MTLFVKRLVHFNRSRGFVLLLFDPLGTQLSFPGGLALCLEGEVLRFENFFFFGALLLPLIDLLHDLFEFGLFGRDFSVSLLDFFAISPR